MPETEQRGDGGEQPEGEAAPVSDTMEEQFDVIVERFRVLQEEARSFGMVTVVGVCFYDPMDMQSYRATLRRGDWFAARGLVQTMAEEIAAE